MTTLAALDLAASTESLTFGVEIETSGLGVSVVAVKLAAKFGWTVENVGGYYGTHAVRMPDGRAFLCLTDGSIVGVGTEVVSPILKGAADLELLQEVVRALREFGCKSSAALQCGIHVHVGVKHLTASQVGRLAKVVAKADTMIRTAVGVSPERATWCAPLGAGRSGVISPDALGAARNLDELAAAWYSNPTVTAASSVTADHYHGSRYRGLNLHSVFYRANHGAAAPRGTAEFRYFDGTLHAGEVKANVQLCLALVAYAARSTSASSKPMAVHPQGAIVGWLRFLVGSLGMKGDAYKTARLHLAKRFPKASPRVRAAAPSVAVAAE